MKLKTRWQLPAAVVLNLALAAGAQAGPHGIFWVERLRASKATAQSNLLYYGGPVLSNAKVYAVFWGDDVAPETKEKIGPFYSNMLDSGYMDWLSEYDTKRTAVDGRQGTGQHIGRGSFAGAVTITPDNKAISLTDAMVQAELEAQIAKGKLPAPDNNSLYMIYFPESISISMDNTASCQDFCAYHESFTAKSGAGIFYGVMPACGGGCGEGDAFSNLTSVSSHETIEAVTDAFPTPGSNPAYPQAWNTTDGQEAADLCAGTEGQVTGHGITSTVQGIWDNARSSCLTGPWSQSEPSAPRTPATPVFNPAWAALKLP